MTFWTPHQFRSWQSMIGWKNERISKELGCNLQTVTQYRKNGCRRSVALACKALAIREGHYAVEVKLPWDQANG